MNKASRKKNDPRDYCRTCGHADWLHTRTYYYACGRGPRSEFDSMYSNEICPCTEYLPEDNLEYLELCFKKRRQS